MKISSVSEGEVRLGQTPLALPIMRDPRLAPHGLLGMQSVSLAMPYSRRTGRRYAERSLLSPARPNKVSVIQTPSLQISDLLTSHRQDLRHDSKVRHVSEGEVEEVVPRGDLR